MQIKLIEARKLAGKTQREMAKIIGISTTSYTNKELGKQQFTITEMFDLANYFNTTLDDLFVQRKTPKME